MHIYVRDKNEMSMARDTWHTGGSVSGFFEGCIECERRFQQIQRLQPDVLRTSKVGEASEEECNALNIPFKAAINEARRRASRRKQCKLRGRRCDVREAFDVSDGSLKVGEV